MQLVEFLGPALLIPSGTLFSNAHDSQDVASVLGELRLDARYWLSDTWAAKFGYALLWIDGVALGSSQPNATTNLFAAPGVTVMTMETNDTVLYHGGFAGIEHVF